MTGTRSTSLSLPDDATPRSHRRGWAQLRRAASRTHAAVYPMELFVLANVVALHVLFYVHGMGLRVIATVNTLRVAGMLAIGLFVAGCLLRLGYAALKGKGRRYLARLRSRSWILLSLRILVACTLTIYFYSALKGLIQILHPVLYDELLWQIDRWTLFGFSPNVFSLYAFQHPAALAVIDVTYEKLFLTTLIVSIAVFFTLESARLRLAFATGCTAIWISSAWLYFLVPSLGPCYAFAEVWEPFRALLPENVRMQNYLMANYQMIRQIPVDRIPPEMHILGGVAAFPSMHVGSQAFIALWLSRLVRPLRIVGYFSVVLIFVGSLVTGWHYLVDSIAGVILAWVCFRLGFVLYGLQRWQSRQRPSDADLPDAVIV